MAGDITRTYAPAARTVWGRALGRDARDGGVEAGERVEVLDWEVGAECDARVVVEDAPEGVEALYALRALWRRQCVLEGRKSEFEFKLDVPNGLLRTTCR